MIAVFHSENPRVKERSLLDALLLIIGIGGQSERHLAVSWREASASLVASTSRLAFFSRPSSTYCRHKGAKARPLLEFLTQVRLSA